jgi:hypothetical protein
MGWNLAPSEGNYDLYNKLPDHLWLRGSDGQYCVVDHKASGEKWRVFDLSQPEMVSRWLEAMVRNPMASGAIDGIFVDSANLKVGTGQWMNCNNKLSKAVADKWNEAHAQLFPAAQRIFGNDGIVLANNMDFPQPGGSNGNNGRFFEEFIGKFDGYRVREDIAKLQHEASKGRFTEAHGTGPTMLGSGKLATTPQDVARCWAQQLAAFLLGAGSRSYFYASLGWSNIGGGIPYGNYPARLAEAWSWTSFHPDLGRALGAPLGPATVTNLVDLGSAGQGGGVLYKRSFAAGTNVSLWCADASCNQPETVVGCIEWADGKNIT